MKTIHIGCDPQVATILVNKIMKTWSPDKKAIVVLRCVLRGANCEAQIIAVNNVETIKLLYL